MYHTTARMFNIIFLCRPLSNFLYSFVAFVFVILLFIFYQFRFQSFFILCSDLKLFISCSFLLSFPTVWYSIIAVMFIRIAMRRFFLPLSKWYVYIIQYNKQSFSTLHIKCGERVYVGTCGWSDRILVIQKRAVETGNESSRKRI